MGQSFHFIIRVVYGTQVIEYEGILKVEDSDSVNSTVDERDLIPDPSFRVNFEECQLNILEICTLRDLIAEYSDVFCSNKFDLGSCSAIKHDIMTTLEIPLQLGAHEYPLSIGRGHKNRSTIYSGVVC